MEPTHAESDRLTPIQGLAELNALLSGDLDAEVVLDRIASLSRRTIPQADQVSVTLMDGDEAWTAVFTGDIARHLDERQYDVGYGPCTDAALSGRTIPVALRSPDTTYPEFSRSGQGLGILNTLSVAMPAPDRVIGGINFYSTSEQPFDPEAVELAEVFASYAAVVLANGAGDGTAVDLPEQLRDEFRDRITVEIAKGVLMERDTSTDRDAYAELQRRARAERRPVSEVAQSVLDAIPRPGGPDRRD